MTLKERIIRKELNFPSNFAEKTEKEWGFLFLDETNPTSHDSNHAVIFPDKYGELEKVLSEIAEFYSLKNIQPRIYQPFTEGFFMDNASILRKNSWDIQIYGKMRFMVLEGKNKIHNERRLRITELESWDDRISRDVLIPNGSLYEIDVLKKSMENKGFHVFAGYLDDRAVCLASLDYTDPETARMASAETAEELRGKGYARELVSYLTDWHRKNSESPLYLWPLNKTAEKIFEEAGFVTSFYEEAGSAIYHRTF